jgi:hypothetical protein
MCRLDTTLVNGAGQPRPDCRLQPAATSSNRIAVTLVATSSLTNGSTINENTVAQVKETWASYTTGLGFSAVPLVAAGSVTGLGNANIVPSPNGAGDPNNPQSAVAVSIWSPCPVDIEQSPPATYPAGCTAPPGSGVGSVSTCQKGDYLKSTPEAELQTTCATSANACGCGSASGDDFLSGHTNSVKQEGSDILDIDGDAGTDFNGEPIPDITFFPGKGYDSPTDSLDDSMFEWIFGQEDTAEGANSVSTNCAGPTNCSAYALDVTLAADTSVANCGALSSASTGLIHISGSCTGGSKLPSQVGTPDAPAIVVVDGDVGDVTLGSNTTFYGMLFVRSNNNTAHLKGVGNAKIFGSVVVEGDVDIAGGIDIVYVPTESDPIDDGLKPSTRFARVPGSWLDSSTGF